MSAEIYRIAERSGALCGVAVASEEMKGGRDGGRHLRLEVVGDERQ